MNAEMVKVRSRFLRGDLASELESGDDSFSGDGTLLLKFHGIYQQDDRDVRRARAQQKLPLEYSCMVRASVPGGVIGADQWSGIDALARLGNGSLRLTTRQGVQYHVVHKGDLRSLVAGINHTGLTTLGACGDVVRNVMACPLPEPRRRAVLQPVVDQLVERFRPRSPAYWELFVDGERAADVTANDREGSIEPVYGASYLPRKFKIGLAWPGDNCVDVYTHDVGVVPTLADGLDGEPTGFVVLAGGGMGMSHARPDDTYPRVAEPVAWVPPDQVVDVIAAIVDIQREHGNRDDRARARLKYLIEERGVAWLRSEIETRSERPLAPPIALPAWEHHAHHGWHGDHLGVPIPSGRMGPTHLAGVRAVIDAGLVDELCVTPRQDLLLCGVTDHQAVDDLLRSHGVTLAADQSALRNLAIACPALPTCGQALGEAERALPDLTREFDKMLADTGNAGLPIRLNMTGCPNGCARPYSAEIGIVGRSKRTYDLYVGGAADRLAQLLRADVPLAEIVPTLRPVFERFASTANPGDVFGDWCAAIGVETLQRSLPAPIARRARRRT